MNNSRIIWIINTVTNLKNQGIDLAVHGEGEGSVIVKSGGQDVSYHDNIPEAISWCEGYLEAKSEAEQVIEA